jgi:hypothetical protein
MFPLSSRNEWREGTGSSSTRILLEIKSALSPQLEQDRTELLISRGAQNKWAV